MLEIKDKVDIDFEKVDEAYHMIPSGFDTWDRVMCLCSESSSTRASSLMTKRHVGAFRP